MSPSDSLNSDQNELHQQIKALDADLGPAADSDKEVMAYAKAQLVQSQAAAHRSPRWALPVGMLAAMVMCVGIYAQMASWIGIKPGAGDRESNIVTRLEAPITIELLPEESQSARFQLERSSAPENQPAVGPWVGVARVAPTGNTWPVDANEDHPSEVAAESELEAIPSNCDEEPGPCPNDTPR